MADKGCEAAQSKDSSAPGSGEPRPKTEKELERERQKAAKLEKYHAKLAAKKAKEEARKPKLDKKAKIASPVAEYVEKTTPGEKKVLQDLDSPALKSYNPKAVESAWYDWWVKSGFFEPEFGPDGKPKKEGVFVITSPPPNVTGALHIGHALTIAIQDSLARWNRMLGKTVLFLGGFDHAGLSTQSVVEKKLWYTQKKTRHDYPRDKFVDIVWEWKEEYHNRIKNQMSRLGGSFDWTREAFTMDENLSRAVVETFVRLHEENIIYRANRLVNWCTALQTTLSNLEVENVDVPGRTLLKVPGYDEPVEVGVLTSIAYAVEGSDERIVIATTRPETLLGDTAVAVHPQDPRYKHLHGKFVKHPFCNRSIPIICDDIIVDMEFGTGAVKITPAHDPNDYEVGKRHNLEFINIFTDDGLLNENCGEFAGMKRFTARVKVVERLKELGLFVGTKENPMVIPLCGKTSDIIEPVMKPQWWVNQKEMAAAAAEVVKSGEIEIAPDMSRREFIRWMENIQDWCISRQLWWGHRIPAYFVNLADEPSQDRSEGRYWVTGRTLEQAEEKAKAAFPGKSFTLEQDEDVLDTWFSSGLWPFSTLGWPKDTSDYENFYPTTLMETGWDILFFWIARMVMLGLKLTGKIPFKRVFCHALVRDAQGRKMSKSLGNVVDPIDVIEGISLQALHDKLLVGNLDSREVEKAKKGQRLSYPKGIPQCGTDALRFTLCSLTTGGRDLNLDILRVEGYRKFCNKLYNATKFALGRLGSNFVPNKTADLTGNESLVEKWIFHRLNIAAAAMNKNMEEMNFLQATSAVHQFWLYELCDVYIENSKYLLSDGTEVQQESAKQTLYTVLDNALRLMHPFMPYVTEEMWQRLPRRPGDKTQTIVKAAFPVERVDYSNEIAAKYYESIITVVHSTRSMMAENGIKSDAVVYIHPDEEHSKLITSESASIQSLIKKCKTLSIVDNTFDSDKCVKNEVLEGSTIFLERNN
ncbi:cytoplasmic valine-tRNA ligase Vrs1/Vas1 [Schizosaccharomyces pombe]|uniref:Valine--tRNA ligase n=1 Tax=Schizosaccharomyces pombe (strain 972 / ATCC 24843) TaxID=284812 RepID=SYV_SCHPO|nr:valine--tRNA (Val) ligase Vrs1/Vas1 [Schizosaccharomyces pombe]O75005.1 RecName: Full=Valine--tRNA ligase; AltName: Full=Valyl-tRNA synthetase; Short=ValRS [Schizosaccharomyces pombe 972h-]CAA21312.1 cytoplasmic valine-tRNA ligase Vrs1/Vas1 [Schizosaccharomyces pombe]|eukprot:NP_595435.1 valine--tRNA (Val) ligase Vrs1/Vas1 [Schizosaccharomyces pombe]